VKTRTATKVLNAALDYAARGWPVLPVAPDEKKPLITDWPNRATTDATRIKKWLRKWSDANIGILTGNGVIVLDVDDHDGRGVGAASLQALVNEFGPLPETLAAKTPGGGQHFYFIGDSATRKGFMPGLDLKGRKGFVVAPPSWFAYGQYVWQTDVPIALIPEWLLEAATRPKPRSAQPPKHTSTEKPIIAEGPIPEALRHPTLVTIARGLRSKGATYETLVTTLTSVNEERCGPPLPKEGHEGVLRIVEWASNQPTFEEEHAAITEAWSRPRSKGVAGITDFKVRLALLEASRVAQSTEVAVSNRRLASLAQVRPQTVRRSLARVIAAGDLERVGRPRRGQSQRYHLVGPTGGPRVPEASHSVPEVDALPRDRVTRLAFGRRQNALRILRALRVQDMTPKGLQAALNLPLATVRDNLRWLGEEGMARPVGRNRWGMGHPSYWELVLDPDLDDVTWFTLVMFYAYNRGMLGPWNRNEVRMADEVRRYDQRFRRRYGVDRSTGEVLVEERAHSS